MGLSLTAVVCGTNTSGALLHHANGSTREADALRNAWRAIVRRRHALG